MIQIFGFTKCQDTKKAERFFKERRLPYQFIDLAVKGLSKGELQAVKSRVGLEPLISQTGKAYKALQMDKIRTPEVRESCLFSNPALYRTPIVRNGKMATVGYTPDVWLTWLKECGY